MKVHMNRTTKIVKLLTIVSTILVIVGHFDLCQAANVARINQSVSEIITGFKGSLEKNSYHENIICCGLNATDKTAFVNAFEKQSKIEGVACKIISTFDAQGINSIFSDANASNNGVILVFKNPEKNLAARESIGSDASAYEALSTFLFLTGQGSKKIKLVVLVDCMSSLDSAVISRFDLINRF